MSEKDNKMSPLMDSLINGVGSFLNTKTVVGDATKIGDTIIVPLVDVSFGVGVGAGSGEKGDKGCGGIGGKLSPSAVLVINNGTTKLVNVKNQDSVTKILDMVPDLVNKFTVPKDNSNGNDAVDLDDAVKVAFPKEDEEV